jgi:DNA-binding Xre family transcriptional regulator
MWNQYGMINNAGVKMVTFDTLQSLCEIIVATIDLY